MTFILKFFFLTLLNQGHSQLLAQDSTDPYLAYEEIHGEEAISWVKRENEKTLSHLKADPNYEPFYEHILANLNSKDKIIYPTLYSDSNIVRNLWKDETNLLGIVRQTNLEKFLTKDYEWETLIDFDELSLKEGKTLVYQGTIYPKNDSTRGLIKISEGGKDATFVREFDYIKKEFLKENAFNLPEGKSSFSWFDTDTVLLMPGIDENEVTSSGYPRFIKIWKRGTDYKDAKVIFEAKKEDLTVSADLVEFSHNTFKVIIQKVISFYRSLSYYYDMSHDKLIKIDVPDDSSIELVYKDFVFFILRSDWIVAGQTFKQGSILYAKFDDLLEKAKNVKTFLEVPKDGSFANLSTNDRFLYVTTIEDISSHIYQYHLDDLALSWEQKELPLLSPSSSSLIAAPKNQDFILIAEESFLRPSALYKLNEITFEKELLQMLPQNYNSSLYVAKQEFAISLDGTLIPYFLIHKKDLKLDGKNPTMQYGYGGFEISLTPHYLINNEFTWLKDGGVYVISNVRGGGEYGPSWHQSALKENRHKSFEDFIAISEDLIEKKITSPKHLGIMGGSNGGLLVGAVMTMRPDLYNAVSIQVPLLDMLRYSKLLAGASWMGEYGNPDIEEERKFLLSYSPYHNLKKEVLYPKPFILTSTADDRVHPGHARKFAKRLEEYSHPFYYFENLEGGHESSAGNEQLAMRNALSWVYFQEMLFPKE